MRLRCTWRVAKATTRLELRFRTLKSPCSIGDSWHCACSGHTFVGVSDCGSLCHMSSLIGRVALGFTLLTPYVQSEHPIRQQGVRCCQTTATINCTPCRGWRRSKGLACQFLVIWRADEGPWMYVTQSGNNAFENARCGQCVSGMSVAAGAGGDLKVTRA